MAGDEAGEAGGYWPAGKGFMPAAAAREEGYMGGIGEGMPVGGYAGDCGCIMLIICGMAPIIDGRAEGAVKPPGNNHVPAAPIPIMAAGGSMPAGAPGKRGGGETTGDGNGPVGTGC